MGNSVPDLYYAQIVSYSMTIGLHKLNLHTKLSLPMIKAHLLLFSYFQ